MGNEIALLEAETESGNHVFGIMIPNPYMLELDDGELCPVRYMNPDEATSIGLKLVQWAAVELARINGE